jgi:hypothetical protein
MAQLQATGVTGSLVTTGNVGVGTTNSTGASRIKLSNPSSGQGATDGFEFIMAALDAYVYNYEAGPMIFGTNSSERMRILSGGNIGIGTTTPAAILDITTGTTNNDGEGIRLDRPSAGTHYHAVEFATAGTVDWSIGQNSNDSFQVYENGAAATTRLTIKEGGNVGIGTVSPFAKLHVNAGTVSTPRGGGFTKFFFTGDNAITTYFELQVPTGSTGDILFSKSSGGDYGIVGYSHIDDSMYFYTKSSPRMYITSNGNVGIGTANPGSYKLNVNGQSAFQDNVTIGSNKYLFTNNISANTNFADLLITGPTNADIVLNGSNVGIGSASPAVKLQVVGANTAEGQLYVGNTDVTYSAGINFTTSGANRGFVGWRHTNSGAPFSLTGVHLFNTDNSNLVFGTNNLVRAVINVNGNLGIGITNPGYKLEVNGVVLSTGYIASGNYDGPASVPNTGIFSTNVTFPDGFGSLIVAARPDTARPIVFATYNGSAMGERMRINAIGNVGIGTTTPSEKLDIRDGKLIFTNTASGRSSTIGMDDNFNFYIKNTAFGNLYIGNGTTTYVNGTFDVASGVLHASSGGNVGIGTAIPTQKLDVRGTIYSLDSGTDGGQIRVQNSGGGNAWYWAARTTGLNLGQLGVADGRMFINNDGNVGIGVTNPGAKFHIDSGDGGATAYALEQMLHL